MNLYRLAALALSFALAASSASPGLAEAGPDVKKTAAVTRPASSGVARPPRDKSETKTRGPLSIGSPNRGRLVDGMRLRPTPHLMIREGARTWGLPALVRLVRNASASVARKHKGSVLVVGDLSARLGGVIDGHNSHQSGRDIDIGFFVANSKGKPVSFKRFLAFDASGRGRDFTWARFDEARNWALVEALLKDQQASVRYIFVASPLRARLLDYAAKKRIPKDLLTRAASVLMGPRDADGHDDHFHVRIACPEPMGRGCVEEPGARESVPALAAKDSDSRCGNSPPP